MLMNSGAAKSSRGNDIQTHGVQKPAQSISEIRKCYPGYENAYFDKQGRLIKG